MEELLSSSSTKLNSISRGQEVEGEVIAITDNEVILDINTKSDGVLSKRELAEEQKQTLKLGTKLKVFVSIPENEVGQVVLSMRLPQQTKTLGRGGRGFSLTKFIQAQQSNNTLSGTVSEVNKGGLMIEVDSARGFLPNSQIGLQTLNLISDGSDSVGKKIQVKVTEADERNKRLVFSQKGLVDKESLQNLKKIKKGEKLEGEVVGIFPFGLAVKVGDLVGLIFASDVSWETTSLEQFKNGQKMDVLVLGLDEELGRINLSRKLLLEDPFTKLAQKYSADDLVKGEILGLGENGVIVKIGDGVEGILPISKMDPSVSYEAGGEITVLIDIVDMQKRKINLAPMVTSTAGLIYK